MKLVRIEKMKKEEAERLHREEEDRLRQKMREAEAKREAERLHQERLKQIEEEKKRDKERREVEGRVKAEDARRKEEEAKQRRDMPVEDSKVVEEMFGFLGDQQPGDFDSSEHTTRTQRTERFRSPSLSPSPSSNSSTRGRGGSDRVPFPQVCSHLLPGAGHPLLPAETSQTTSAGSQERSGQTGLWNRFFKSEISVILVFCWPGVDGHLGDDTEIHGRHA